MKRLLLSAALCGAAATAQAAEVAPAEVEFGEYGAVSESLTGQPGDPAAGRKVFMNRKLGNCLACHANSDMSDQGFHGEVGPPLDGVATRWTEADLRGIVVNSKNVFPGSIMPAFYIGGGYERPLEQFAGKPVLTAQQVEDVVAYLMTLNEEM